MLLFQLESVVKFRSQKNPNPRTCHRVFCIVVTILIANWITSTSITSPKLSVCNAILNPLTPHAIVHQLDNNPYVNNGL
jgi:hypothetical protein